MKFYLTPFFPALLVLLLLISACRDDEAAPEAEAEKDPFTEKKMLLSGEESKIWLLKKVTVQGNDITPFYLEPCDRDNPYVLYANGKGEIRKGKESCQEDEAEVLHEGNWELNQDRTTLTLNIGQVNKDSKIVEITQETLKIEFQEMGQTIVASYDAQI